MDLAYSSLELRVVSAIVDDVICNRGLRCLGELGVDSLLRIAFSEPITREESLSLLFRVSRHYDQGGELPVALVFHEKRGIVNDVGRVGALQFQNPLGASLGDFRMKNGVERCALFRIPKDDGSERGAVELTRGVEYPIAESFGDLEESLRSRRHDVSSDLVCVDNRDTPFKEKPGYGALATGDVPGKADHRTGHIRVVTSPATSGNRPSVPPMPMILGFYEGRRAASVFCPGRGGRRSGRSH